MLIGFLAILLVGITSVFAVNWYGDQGDVNSATATVNDSRGSGE